MHIALLTAYFPPNTHSGIGRYVEDLALGLAKKGHEVEVISLTKVLYPETSRNGFRVYWLINTSAWMPSYLPFLRLLFGSYKCRQKLIAQHKIKPFDVVEYPNTGIAGLICLLMRFPSPRPKFIVRLVSPRSVFKKHFSFFRITEFLEALQVRFSDAVISVSQTNFKVCVKSYRFSIEKPYQIIMLGLSDGIKPCFTDPLSKSDKRLRVFFLGRMEDRKGFDVLAKAWPKVVAKITHVKLIVAGEDLSHKGEESYFRWAIRGLSEQVCKQIEYLGAVDDKSRELLYQQCDVCVIPSRYESFGLISLEAMRYGKPVVSTNVGGIPEVVTHGATGLLVPVDDHDALADALINILKDENLREQLGRNALADVIARFSPERVINETESFYRSLME